MNIINDVPKIISYCCNILKRIKKKESIIYENMNTKMIKEKNNENEINDNDNNNEELDQDIIKNNKIKNKKIKILYSLQIQEKNTISENSENAMNNNIFGKNNFNYKEINSLIFFPNIEKENQINFFKNTLEILKNENNEQFSIYINSLNKDEQKMLQEIFEK
jgi:hypothetical protein